MIIFNKDERNEKLKEIENNLSKRGKMYIYGVAQTAVMLTDFCKKHSNIEIAAYIVDDEYYTFDMFEGRTVYKASEWRKIAGQGDYVLLGFINGKRARALQNNMPDGVEGVYFCFPYSANVSGEFIDYDYYQKHKNDFEATYHLLEDEFSRKVMQAYVNGCVTGNMEDIEKLHTDGQYFNELTQNYNCEYFIDVGAYVGDTIEEAYDFYKASLKQVVAFEPDEKNIASMRKRMTECNIGEDKWTLINKGSWSEETSLYFSSFDSSSRIAQDGDIEIKVDSVDHVLGDRALRADYIKMDIEGSELEAVKGAANTIQNYHPMLAICVYHKRSDLFEIVQTVQKIAGPDVYKFYLRYHGFDLRELVLYALPK